MKRRESTKMVGSARFNLFIYKKRT